MGYKKGSNHTLTMSKTDETVDYPIWPLAFTESSMKMYPAIDCKCMVIAPFAIKLQPVAFPDNDSLTEFRVDYASAMGKKLYFIFALTPHMSPEDKDKQYEMLEKDFG